MALAEGTHVRDLPTRKEHEVLLGDDFVAPAGGAPEGPARRRAGRGLLALRGSSLTRKIITFNLIALNVMVAGILYLTSSRDGLAGQRAQSLLGEVELIADLFAARMPDEAPVSLIARDGLDAAGFLDRLRIAQGVDAYVFDPSGVLAARATGTARRAGLSAAPPPTVITDALARVWEALSGPFGPDEPRGAVQPGVEAQLRAMVGPALRAGAQMRTGNGSGGQVFAVAAPIRQGARPVGVVALASTSGEVDNLVRAERERILQMFIIATLVSVGLSLILASTIANPLADLAAAAEVDGDRARGGGSAGGGRVRIPDLSARPDEIGRLSAALRGMVAALYHRIDSNEQFAADVTHEIKNPLASLRSAVGTMRIARREDQRARLLEVIEHDVRRLDRLVSDISSASRLDSELVKEEQEAFDLLAMLRKLGTHLDAEAGKKGIEFITDFPDQPIVLTGLEGRLAQVFVNLIDNAISFCEEGDAIRVWARRRANRVLVVVEDTGPGIPEEALTKVFQRFYSQRAASDFGNNSGLGLAISKQIVEAHDGVIWAENIRPTDADPSSDPLGARFVVGFPV